MSAYKSVNCAGSVGSVSDAVSALVELGDECREIVDNASEGLAQTQRIQTLDETASALEGLDDPDVPDVINEVKFNYGEAVPTRKGRGTSRATRRDNALAVLCAARDAVEEWLDGLPELDENRDDVDTFVTELGEIIDAAESVEFPGMFG